MTTTHEDRRQAVLAQSVREIRRLRAELDAVDRARNEPIAIVGMACRMPGGEDTESFWEFLSRGGDGVTDIPAARLEARLGQRGTGPATTAPVERGGFLTDIDRFDAAFFGISPREAASLDPQQRLLLEVSYEALEDAGQSPEELAGTPTGVYFGITNYDYCQLQMQQVDPDELDAYTLTSNASTFAAGRLAFWLGLTGPALSVDTACSSSLVGVHLACQSLRAGESSTALAGGVNVLLVPEWSAVLSKARMLSPSGRCRTFDSGADGYVRSEGCGVVVLKRLSDAVAHGDRVLALIRGSAVNQDGRSGGITVPNPAAQQDVIERAMRAAAVEPAAVDYVETHGTGTPLGDPIELRALHRALGDRKGRRPLLVGSVKTNIGHLEPAAGVAGLIKVVLSLQHEQVPPHLHLTEVNPEIPLDEMGMRIPTTPTPWPKGTAPRVAGVSSFGASGTNAHVVLEEAPAADPVPEPGAAAGDVDRGAHLLTLSARTPQALVALAERYRDRLAIDDQSIADVCFTTNAGRAHLPHRLVVTGSSRAQFRSSLTAFTENDHAAPPGVRTGHCPTDRTSRVAFLFTGQGAQYAGMARTLYRVEPVFRRVLDHCDLVLTPLLGRDLSSVLDPAPEDAELVHDTRFTQPALFAVEYALAELWRSWGVEPSAVLGHSVGELVAACVAGAMPVDDGLRLAAARGRMMQEMCRPGAMAAVFADEDRVRRVLPPSGGTISIAAVNGPDSVVVSGEDTSVAALLGALAEDGVRSRLLGATRAFHSPLIDPMLDAFEAEAAGIGFGAPRVTLISNVTGDELSGEDALSAAYLREHARAPVQFLRGTTTLLDQGHRILLEIGPAPTLLGLARRFAGDATGADPIAFLPSLRPRRDDCAVMLDSLGALHALGVEVDWTGVHEGRGRRRVALPAYPFHRDRHWFRPSDTRVAGRDAARAADSRGSLLGRRIASPLDTVQFESRLDASAHDCLGDCVMDGLRVINIGVYLDTALAAWKELEGPGPVLVEECLVLQSLVIDPGGSLATQLTVDTDDGGRRPFRYYAVHGDAGQPHWIRHAQGALRAADPDHRLRADLTALRDRLDQELSGEEFYRRMSRRGLHLGPSARWIDRVRYGSAGDALAEMRAARPGEADRYLLHPGLTDAMFQVLFACLPQDGATDAAYLLVGIDRFRLDEHDRIQPLYCHATLLPSSRPGSTLVARVRLHDATGTAVVEADGVCLTRVDPADLRRAAPTRSGAENPLRSDPRPTATQNRATRNRSSRPVREEILRAGTADRPARIEALLTDVIARVLGADPTGIDVDEPLHNLGLDSLTALEARDALSGELGVAVPLASFLEGRTVTRLVEEILALLPATAEGGTATCDDALPVLVPDPAARYEPFPLTDLQQAYLVGRTSAFELGNISTYFFVEVDVDGIDLDRLTRALRRMVDRHDMLRAVVAPDGVQRVLAEVSDYLIRTVDLTGCTEAERTRRLAEIHREVAEQVFDTTTWPLWDVRATRIDDRRTRLHIGLDALVIDAWSTSLLFREWATAYRDESVDLGDLAVTYRDYVLAARSLDGSPRHRASQEYWRDRLATLPPAPELPLARNPASLTEPTFTHRSTRLDSDEWTRFKRHAAAAGVTASVAVCTAYAQVLAAWSRSGHFTLNVLFFNRLPLHDGIDGVVGNFSATTLLEIRCDADEDFATRAERAQRQLWTDLEHSHVSGVQVLRDLNRLQGSTSRATMPVVFASTVNFATRSDGAAATGLAQHLISMGDDGREVSSSIRTPQVWLDHQVVEDGGELVVNWDVIEEIFPPGMADAMFEAYGEVLRELCHDEAAWRRPAPVLVPPVELALRKATNETSAPIPGGLLQEPFLARVRTDPDATAIIAPDRTIDYGQLDRESNRVGHWLLSRGIGPGQLVAVVMDKGWEQVVAVLGVLKAGGAYVPVDATVPAERLRLLLDSAGIGVALTQPGPRARIEWPADVDLFTVEAGGTGDDGPLPPSPAKSDDLAYVIFTSGSTGLPKGVMIEHAGALNTVEDINERFGITANDRVLALSALNFDLSVWDVFGMLAAGGAIVLPEPTAHREPGRWAELVAEHGVTVWNTVPALMEMFTEHLAAEPTGEPPLRTVMMSGDWIPVTLADRIRSIAPRAAIWSLGGATEASIWSICYPIEKVDTDWASIPYGRPMRNQRFHVLDEAMRPRPVWVPGDLYIAGAGLARGYLGDAARTAASFVHHPTTGERLYRTGDLGRYLPDGNIEFLGREDSQVKIQGYRIELGEVESALLDRPGVRAAVAAAVGERHGGKRLVAYVVVDAEHPSGADEAELDAALRRTLPDYLVPQRIVVLDALPLSANGKVDRKALPSPDGPASRPDAPVPPRDDIELRLAGIWAQYFDTSPLDVTASFFELGGDSLRAVRLMARIKSEMGVSLPLSTLFARPTIELLADSVRENVTTASRQALVPIRRDGTGIPLFFVHPVGGDVLCYAELAELLAPQPFYGLQVPDTEPHLTDVAQMAAHYAREIATAVPHGPCRVGGWSMGGVIAVEVARLLVESGREVDLVTVVDLLEPPGPTDADLAETRLLAWFARDLAGIAGRTWTPDPKEFDVDGRRPLEVLRDAARAEGVLPHDIDTDTLDQIVVRFSHNAGALARHRPRPYPGRVRFLRAEGGASTATAREWSGYFGDGSHVLDLPGDHYTVMRPPHLHALAEHLRR